MRDVGNATSGYIYVPEPGTWYAAISAYDADGFEGEYSTPNVYYSDTDPEGTITLHFRVS